MTDTDSKRIYTENIRISKLLFVWSNVSYRKIILNNYTTIVPKNVWIKVMGKNKNLWGEIKTFTCNVRSDFGIKTVQRTRNRILLKSVFTQSPEPRRLFLFGAILFCLRERRRPRGQSPSTLSARNCDEKRSFFDDLFGRRRLLGRMIAWRAPQQKTKREFR